MVSLFKERSAVSVFWLIIICFGLHAYALLNAPQISAAPTDGFFYYMLHPFTDADAYLASLAYVFIIFLLALQLNFVLSDLRLLPKPAYTPALAFLLFSALLPAFNVINPALFASNIFIWILYRACKLYAAPKPKTSIYNLGLLTGLCVLLYFPSAPLVLIILIALAIIRPFRLDEWFVLFFGILTPAYFLAGYLFLTDQFSILPSPQQVFGLLTFPLQPLLLIITLAVAAASVLWGIFSVQNAGANVLIQVRKSWYIFLVSFLFFIPVIFFIKGAYPSVLLVIAIPAACFTGYAFANSKNILPVIFFWALISLAVYNNWFVK